MAAPGGRRRAEGAGSTRGPLLALGLVLAGAAVGALAWFVLVRAAIDFGGEAKNGETVAWLFMGLATVGAIACLVLALVLVSRALSEAGLVGRRPRSGSGSSSGPHRH